MQEWIVGLAVACAFLVVVKRYMPKTARTAMRSWAAATARRFGFERLAARFAVTEQAASCSDGCGSCGGCGTNSPPPSDERFVIKLKATK